MKNTLQLIEINSSKLEREFINLPKRLYKDNKYWVCPSDSAIRNAFDPKQNVQFDGGEAIRWIAVNAQGETLGRIAAFYNHKTASIEEQPTGGCGFFECVNDQAVANLLFDAARDWLAGKGMEAMDGPINFGSREAWWGVLVEGYDYEPLYENVYNHEYYKTMFESYGFQNYFNQNSYLYRIGIEQHNPSIDRRANRLLADPAYEVRNIKGRKLRDVADDFREIYNRAWAAFPGVEPMSVSKSHELIRSFQPIVDPNIILFTFHENKPIGFFIMVPDINPILKKFNGRFGLWQKLKLLWKVRYSKDCNRIFGVIFGVSPDYQFKGVESAIMIFLRDNFVMTPRNKRYDSLEFAWIGDFNPTMNKMIEKYVGAVRHKQHTTYRYLFDREKEFKRCPSLVVKR